MRIKPQRTITSIYYMVISDYDFWPDHYFCRYFAWILSFETFSLIQILSNKHILYSKPKQIKAMLVRYVTQLNK